MYRKYVEEFCQFSGAERGRSYEVNEFAKKIRLPPVVETAGNPVLVDNRLPPFKQYCKWYALCDIEILDISFQAVHMQKGLQF